MKIIKTTHYRNHEESETSDYTLFESNNQQEVTKKFKRTCELLIHFEGLQCIAPKSIGCRKSVKKCLLGTVTD